MGFWMNPGPAPLAALAMQLLVQTPELLSKLLSAGQQRLHDQRQVRHAIKELANARLEFQCANNTDFEAEVAQQAAYIVWV